MAHHEKASEPVKKSDEGKKGHPLGGAMNLQARVESLNHHIEAGTLVRNEWGDGQERACLLAALAPETAKNQSASACPVEVMPRWLAELTPWMDDKGSLAKWPKMIRRYAALAGRWHVLSEKDWQRCMYESLNGVLQEALTHVGPEFGQVAEAVVGVNSLLSAATQGLEVGKEDWDAAARAAAAAAAAAYAYDAAYAAVAAARAAAANVIDAARAAAAAAAAYADVIEDAAVAAARAAAVDRITSGVLDVIERAIEAKELRS